MRGRRAKRRKASRDPKYNSELAAKFINKIMLHGKKSLAEKIFYTALESGAKELNVEPIDLLNQAIDNVRPALEIRARRVGGANYQVPVAVSPARQETLAIRWIVDTTRNKAGSAFDLMLRKEIVDAYNKEGDAIKKKDDTERMAEANKAFAHFRW